MSHLVETMAYTNEVPWHGLGEYVAQAPNVSGMLKAAKLDWRVEKKALQLADGTPVPGHFGIVRDRDNKVLDVVGSDYKPSQNKDTFAFFKEFVEAGNATMETAGSLKEGRMVWGLAKLNKGFKIGTHDQVNNYLLLASPHEQGKSLIIRATNVRVVCNNTITLALRGKAMNEFRMNHRNEFDERMISKAKDVLGIARETLGEFEDNARKLHKLKMTRDDAIRVLAPIFQKNDPVDEIVANANDPGTFAPRMKLVMDVLERAPGAEPDTAWGVLNAVTYWADHLASRTPDKRLERAWMGKNAMIKEQALDALLELAA